MKFYLLNLIFISMIFRVSNAQEKTAHLDAPIWSSEQSHDLTFNESLARFELTEETIQGVNKAEIEVAKQLFQKNILLKEKTLEVRKIGEKDLLFLRYYYSSKSSSEIDFENSIVSFPLQKINYQPNLINPNSEGNVETLSGLENPSPKKVENQGNASLAQNYPNPFFDETKIIYSIPSTAKSARIVISDMYGRQLLTFDSLDSKTGHINVNRRSLSKGIYFYHLVVDEAYTSTKKMIVK